MFGIVVLKIWKLSLKHDKYQILIKSDLSEWMSRFLYLSNYIKQEIIKTATSDLFKYK